MAHRDPETVLAGYRRARAERAPWESLWQDAVDHTLPQRDHTGGGASAAGRKGERLFDATAGDAAEQLAASLLAQLTPPWSRWFGLSPGAEVAEGERDTLGETLATAETVLQGHLDRSNFAVEIHQCYLDLVVYGTACLQFEEAPLGAASAFRFTAVPLTEVALEEGPDGALDVAYRRREVTAKQLASRFGTDVLPRAIADTLGREAADARRYGLVEAVLPDGVAHDYMALLEEPDGADGPPVLAEGRFAQSPFITFRWMTAPGEIYGRSPVMRALPDIKTANKVVELTLKNASIAVAGIWQADDDGVLNPANVRLTPGSIIPKAVGSHGLQPLEPSGNFDVSQLVLSDLRERIRRTLLVNQLGAIDSPNMTATEVLERTAEVTRLLGATYGRLQAELLTPVIGRALAILSRRGAIPPVPLDGRLVELQARSPLAQVQARKDIANTITWVEKASALGEEGLATVDLPATARWLGEMLSVPGHLMRDAPKPPSDGGAPRRAPAAGRPASDARVPGEAAGAPAATAPGGAGRAGDGDG